MAEQVNQRIEDMINELEQMRRTGLFDDDEIKQISKKRKEFEYHIQRKEKQKEDFTAYIIYEIMLLKDISLRRKQKNLWEKKNEIEYAIAKRVNKVFKQFVFRFQDDIQIYFEHIRFCKSVGFSHAIPSIIEQMLQIHGDKPRSWIAASKWESKERNNMENARAFLLKGLQRHPFSPTIYFELFEIELINLTFKSETDEDKEKFSRRADIVWKNCTEILTAAIVLLQFMDLCIKYETKEPFVDIIKQKIWAKRDDKLVWCYIAAQELNGIHWKEVEDFVADDHENGFPKELNYFIGLFEEALQQFPDKDLCRIYINQLLKIGGNVCTDYQKILAVKRAWLYGNENGLLTMELYSFGMKMFKLENHFSEEQLMQILDAALMKNRREKWIWREKILLVKENEEKMLSVLDQAKKVVKPEDYAYLFNEVLENVKSEISLKNMFKRFQSCENAEILELKTKFLVKTYTFYGIKAARKLYEELIRTPPSQLEMHQYMIEIETAEPKLNIKNIRKAYECAVQQHGTDSVDIWTKYLTFETKNNAHNAPSIYRRAVAALKKECVDEFIKAQSLAKIADPGLQSAS